MILQIESLKSDIDALHQKHGDRQFTALYGTGCIDNPRVMFLFMNPTARNVAVNPNWTGMRAPWVGFKQTWKLMHQLGLIDQSHFSVIQGMKSSDWTDQFVADLYSHFAGNKAYLTNLARCTLADARAVPNSVFRDCRDITLREIEQVGPDLIIAFGNQVASNLLQVPIKVTGQRCHKYDLAIGHRTFPVYPTYYPVGMGYRNINLAIEDITAILGKN